MKTFGNSFDLSPSWRPSAWRRRPLALVVDDDPDIRDLLQVGLGTFFGCQVEVAGSASDAIRKIECRNFDFVVCDLLLGGESGLDVFYFLRNHPERSAPFILFSGHSSTLLPFEGDRIITVDKTDLSRLFELIEGMGFPTA